MQSHAWILEAHESKAPTLPVDGVVDDLALTEFAVLLEMPAELLLSERVVQSSNEDLVLDVGIGLRIQLLTLPIVSRLVELPRH
jgi:hypothetical protein